MAVEGLLFGSVPEYNGNGTTSQLLVRVGEFGFDTRDIQSSFGFAIIYGDSHEEVHTKLTSIKSCYEQFLGYTSVKISIRDTSIPINSDAPEGNCFGCYAWRVA